MHVHVQYVEGTCVHVHVDVSSLWCSATELSCFSSYLAESSSGCMVVELWISDYFLPHECTHEWGGGGGGGECMYTQCPGRLTCT